MIINKVQQSDGGTYQCVARSIIRTVSQDVVLQVSSKSIIVYACLNIKFSKSILVV